MDVGPLTLLHYKANGFGRGFLQKDKLCVEKDLASIKCVMN